ncbi:hypothetical protein A33M_4331 [Rhodovulum sp. PH10]|nr:hypothetical protein A33M_4331 [Rhodovulum sp. PH10]
MPPRPGARTGAARTGPSTRRGSPRLQPESVAFCRFASMADRGKSAV